MAHKLYPLRKKLMSVKSTFFGKKGASVFYDENTQAEELPQESPMGRSVFYSQSDIEEEKEKDKKEKVEGTINTQEIRVKLPVTVLWAESQAVVTKGILENMTTYEIALQEAKFEIITSELRYLNSLNVLLTTFYESKDLSALCTKEEWQSLFGNILTVKEASGLVLHDLLSHWENDVMLTGIYPILRRHAVSVLRVYVEYCRNQPMALVTLQSLMVDNEGFMVELQRIETDQGSTLMSYLALPMQRVTRLPLLLSAILSRLDQSTSEYTLCRLSKAAIKQLAQECNAAVVNKNVNLQANKTEEKVKRSKSLATWKL